MRSDELIFQLSQFTFDTTKEVSGNEKRQIEFDIGNYAPGQRD